MLWLTGIYLLYCVVLLLVVYSLFIRNKPRRKHGSSSRSSTDKQVRLYKSVQKKGSVVWWFLYPCCLTCVIGVFWNDVSPGMALIDSWWCRPAFIWFHYISSLICWLSCVASSPGAILKELDGSLDRRVTKGGHNTEPYCRICQVSVSPGSKHCYYCNICVPSWDHHCLWVHNCIARRNIPVFTVFLIHCAWMWLHGAYICTSVAIQQTPKDIQKPSFIVFWLRDVVNHQFLLALYATLLYIGGMLFLLFSGTYLYRAIKGRKQKYKKY